jgi:hypothetical protein
MTVTFVVPARGDAERLLLNVSNTNYRHLMDSLGLNADRCFNDGEVNTLDMVAGAIRLYRHLNSGDAEEFTRTERVEVAPGVMEVIQCGVDVGYMLDKAQTLYYMASRAIERHRRLEIH